MRPLGEGGGRDFPRMLPSDGSKQPAAALRQTPLFEKADLDGVVRVILLGANRDTGVS